MSLVLIVLAVLVAAHLAAVIIATRVITASIAADNEPGGQFVPVTGGRLHYYDVPARNPAAQAPVILLLHGATGNARDMLIALAEPLSKTHRVIAIDRPGHGWSDRPGGRADASPARQAQLIVEALDQLHIPRVVVVGYSWSGALATNLALDHADRVSALALISGVTHPWPGGVNWYYTVGAAPLLGPIFVNTLLAPIASYDFKATVDGSFAPNQPPADYARKASASLILRPDEFIWNAQDVADLLPFVVRQSPRYGEIKVPTAVITGDADTTVSPTIHSAAIARQIAGAKLTILPGVGHMPHHVATAVVVAEIERVAAEARP